MFSPSPSLHPTSIETWFGFIKDVRDAALLVESCIAGCHKPTGNLPVGMTSFPIRSGSTVVFPEGSESLRVRWRDGGNWSASKVHGSFLLYREVQLRNAMSPNIPERLSPFSVTAVRRQHTLVPGGFAKRTISMTGSDRKRYRVINYFLVQDVLAHYATNCSFQSPIRTPTQLPEFDRYAHLMCASPSLLPSQDFTSIPHASSWSILANVGSAILEHDERLRRFRYESIRFGGSGLQAKIKWFAVNPNWTEHPVYLPRLLQHYQCRSSDDVL
ncbi:hypothetical protein BC830DRAFT_784121 [Chytriomyces sp. MP71]|nr:hypothetical protein BC830DRAFT_784121 [Chytriomyces sp. MP71]